MAKRLTTQDFIIRAVSIHGLKYNYSKVKYTNLSNKIIIICPIHGEFEQTPNNHLNGKHGCSACTHTHVPNNNQFIEKAQKVHGDRYDYSKVNYLGTNNKIIIICPIHGEFLQSPGVHITNKCGCTLCSNRISVPENLWLDSLSVHADLRQKTIFIDNKWIKADAFDESTNTVYEFWGDFWHGNPKIFDKDKVNKLTKCTFGELFNKTQRKRQLILDAGYNLIEIWEYEFNKLNHKI